MERVIAKTSPMERMVIAMNFRSGKKVDLVVTFQGDDMDITPLGDEEFTKDDCMELSYVFNALRHAFILSGRLMK